MSDVVRISAAEAFAKMNEGYAYIDVRTPEEFAAGHPKGAMNVPMDDDFVARMTRYPKDTPLVLGCRSGNRSLRAARTLIGAGYTKVLEQRAGYEGARGPFGELIEQGWSAEGLPVEF
jgi:rhodanese-related sulfurtransferase